jgi:hypothetical protein
MHKDPKPPPLQAQLNEYKSLYLQYFNECHELSNKCIEMKLRRVELKAEIASLKLDMAKLSLPYLGEIN